MPGLKPMFRKSLSVEGANADALFGPVCMTVRTPDNPQFVEGLYVFVS